MKILTTEFKIFNREVSLATLLWFFLAALGAVLKIRLGADKIGNYYIFKNAFWHAVHGTSLYQYYPAEKLGDYLYGPLFSALIAPFAVLPVPVGAFLWSIFNAGVLWIAIRKLPVTYRNQQIILFICMIEMLTSIENMQINCFIAALVILSFSFVKKGKDFWATFFIAFGFLVKVYGIVGLVFLFFSGDKKKFIWSFLLWVVILGVLPVVLTSPTWLAHTYHEWYYTLIAKNQRNQNSLWQNLSVMGMLKHIFGVENKNLLVMGLAGLCYGLPLLRIKQIATRNFQFLYLAFGLIGLVIYSSGAESPTYIIAMTGVAIWYCFQDKRDWRILALLIFAWVLTSLSVTDLFPPSIKDGFIRPYSLKALPSFIIWLVIAWNLMVKDFRKDPVPELNS
ncbi:MAG: DUF2029 domain-containing protein [Bacteroidota bacterium]|nr:DUF2029 domain-containing protein [Bacteroidota bacterium]